MMSTFLRIATLAFFFPIACYDPSGENTALREDVSLLKSRLELAADARKKAHIAAHFFFFRIARISFLLTVYSILYFLLCLTFSVSNDPVDENIRLKEHVRYLQTQLGAVIVQRDAYQGVLQELLGTIKDLTTPEAFYSRRVTGRKEKAVAEAKAVLQRNSPTPSGATFTNPFASPEPAPTPASSLPPSLPVVSKLPRSESRSERRLKNKKGARKSSKRKTVTDLVVPSSSSTKKTKQAVPASNKREITVEAGTSSSAKSSLPTPPPSNPRRSSTSAYPKPSKLETSNTPLLPPPIDAKPIFSPTSFNSFSNMYTHRHFFVFFISFGNSRYVRIPALMSLFFLSC